MASLDIRLSQILSRHDPPEARACLRALSARPALAVEEEKDRRRMASANIRSLLAYDLIAAGLGLKPGAISKNGHIFSTSSLQFFGLGALAQPMVDGSRRYVGRDGFMERQTSLMTVC